MITTTPAQVLLHRPEPGSGRIVVVIQHPSGSRMGVAEFRDDADLLRRADRALQGVGMFHRSAFRSDRDRDALVAHARLIEEVPMDIRPHRRRLPLV